MKRDAVAKIFSRIPTLNTDRLIMRKIGIDDVEDMYEYSKDPLVTKYLLWSPHPDRTHTYEYINYLQSRYRCGDFHDWAVVYRESGKMIGTCGFTRLDLANNSAELGYVINPNFYGLGIATEAARRIIEFGFDELGLNRIECRYIVGNDASLKVMKKIGMLFEGIRREGMLIKGAYRDIGICAIVRSDYLKLRSEQKYT